MNEIRSTVLPYIQLPWSFGQFCVWAFGLIAARITVLLTLEYLSQTKWLRQWQITRTPEISEGQKQRETEWKQGFLIDLALIFFFYPLGLYDTFGLFSWESLAWTMFWHVTVVEFLYYWFHRALHIRWLYKNYHEHHHRSVNTQPATGITFLFGERLAYTLLFAIPSLLAWMHGQATFGATALFYIWFDIMNEGGHINCEVFPNWFASTPLWYIFYTPSYHSIHHTLFKANYALFMLWPDMLFGTYAKDKTLAVFNKATTQKAAA